MTFDRRTFVAGLGAALPASLISSCARAADGEWPGPDTPANELPKLPIGMNLSGIADYDPGFPFRNLMWGARPWLSRNAFGGGAWNTEQAPFFEYDENGYPLEVPITTPGSKGIPQQLFTVLPNVRKMGRYVIYYDGEGTFDAGLGSKIVSEHPGRVTIHMTHDQKLAEVLAIRTSKRGNHVRNIRVLAEGEDPETLASQPFLPEFLDFCKPFHVLRLMDWGATNNSLEDEWSSRRKPGFYTMIGTGGDAEGYWGPKPDAFTRRFAGGVPHEIMAQLANQLKTDIWICIPHRASDEYIRECSKLYRERLDRNRRVYVEYSNELWNWGFQQSQWMLRSRYAGDIIERQGVQAWEDGPAKLKGKAHPERIGALFTRAYGLWLEHWRGKDRQRVTTVCAVQAAWSAAALRTIDWCYKDGSIDAVSPAAYFGPDSTIYAEWDRRGSALTADEVIKSMWHVLEQQGGEGSMYQIALRAKQLGLPLINYEGGQHITPERQQEKPYMPALEAAQTHPDMYRLYLENLRQQKRLGSQLFCAFSSIGRQGTRWGSWGSKESYTAPTNSRPKLRALLDCNI